VVERLNDSDVAALAVKLSANRFQKGQRICDAGLFLRQSGLCPLRDLGSCPTDVSATIAASALQHDACGRALSTLPTLSRKGL